MARPLPSALFLLPLLLIVGCESVRPGSEPVSDAVARRLTIETERRRAAREASTPLPDTWLQQLQEEEARLKAQAAARAAALAAAAAEPWPEVTEAASAEALAAAIEATFAVGLRKELAAMEAAPPGTLRTAGQDAREEAERRALSLAQRCAARWWGKRRWLYLNEISAGMHVWSVACLMGGPGERVAAAESAVEIRRWRLPDGRRVVGSFKGPRLVAVAFE